jgi:DNA-binding MarR family transcriptional regulator
MTILQLTIVRNLIIMDLTNEDDMKTSTGAADTLPSETLPGVFQLITRLAKRLALFQRRTIRETGLTPPQYFVLSMLLDRDGIPLKDLAEASGSTRATTTGVVDTLEKKGLVIREPHPLDRRSMLVRLTDRGRRVHDTAPGTEQAFQTCCAPLEKEEMEELARLLRKLDSNLTLGE